MIADSSRETVVIAGATGFIGRALSARLAETFRVVGLSRRAIVPEEDGPVDEWRQADLFSMSETEKALAGADYAVYLVHSMLPQDRLTQANFADLDVLLADNFARASKAAGVKKIIYLGGLIPDVPDLSAHLKSRLETEAVLASYDVPVITLRAGLILGQAGSSSQILARLVQRLPAMLCPLWTQRRVQPIVLDDVIDVLCFVTRSKHIHEGVFDVGGSDVVTYRELMEKTAAALGLRRRFFNVPIGTPRLATAWVTMITRAPLALVSPLVESLAHDMVASNNDIWTLMNQRPRPTQQGLDELANVSGSSPHAFRRAPQRTGEGSVRSVQRLPNPNGASAVQIARSYLRWLPRFFSGFIEVRIDGTRAEFLAPIIRAPILVLDLAVERTFGDRPLFRIVGGLLVRRNPRARFEFREACAGRITLAAIHDFKPRLWWPIYRLTQAPFHAFVMAAFGRYLTQTTELPEMAEPRGAETPAVQSIGPPEERPSPLTAP